MEEVKLPPVANVEKNMVLATITTNDRGLVLRSVEDIRTVSQIVFQSKLAPESFKTPEAIFVAIQHGAELGLKPMQSLQSIYVIKGKPTLWGDAALAMVKKSGLCKEYSEVVEGDGDNMIAKVHSVRRDNNDIVDTSFSVAEAEVAGLWKKTGPWTTHPKRMLKYKARAFNLRDNFPDVTMGMHITEEMMGEDMPPIPKSDVEPRELRRKPAQDAVVTDRKPVSDTDGSTVAEDAGKVNEPLLKNRIVSLFAVTKYGQENVTLEVTLEFMKWAGFVLCEEPDDLKDMTDDQLNQLKRELETNGVVDYEQP